MSNFVAANQAAEKACPFREFQPCLGDYCMAWTWSGPRFESRTTNNLVKTPEGDRPGDGLPPRPDGDGWIPHGPTRDHSYHRRAKDNLPHAIAQDWRRPIERTRGGCSRLGAQPYYSHDEETPF